MQIKASPASANPAAASSHPQKKCHSASLTKPNNRTAIEAARQQLPVHAARHQILQVIRQQPTTILVCDTGTGKSTQVPQFLLESCGDSSFLSGKKMIACTQPRRVAAVHLAKRVALEMDSKLGDRVGYSVRFDDCTSSSTLIKYMTDGLLLRELLMDPLLQRYGVVILDEAHERTLRTDILFGMIKRILKERTNDFKVVIMSATLDVQAFQVYFNNAQIVHVEGRQYPVKLLCAVEPQPDYLDAALTTILQIHIHDAKRFSQQGHLGKKLEGQTAAGDILVFLTGQEEIESLEKLVRDCSVYCPPEVGKLIVCPLYANLPSRQQALAFEKAPPGCRKVILATNVAETSVTISGVRFVVDTGFRKNRGYQSKLGMESLQIEPISKASARQRAGRAGREAPGICYRLYTEQSFQQLQDAEDPEIQRCNLASVILLLMAVGVTDVLSFDFMDRPPREAFVRSLEELYILEAINDEQQLTDLGRQMASFPLEPAYAKILIRSKDYHCTKEVISILALLSVENVFQIPHEKREEAFQATKKFKSNDGDYLTALNAYSAFLAMGKDRKWCHEHFINIRALKHVMEVEKQLKDVCQRVDLDPNESCMHEYDKVLRCFMTGLFQNIALRQPDQTYKSLYTGKTVYIHPSSVLFQSKVEAVMYSELVLTTRVYMRNVCRISPLWLTNYFPSDKGR